MCACVCVRVCVFVCVCVCVCVRVCIYVCKQVAHVLSVDDGGHGLAASYTAKADAVLNDPSYGSRARKTIHDHDARAEVIDSFMSSLTARRCPNCRGFSPSIKRYV